MILATVGTQLPFPRLIAMLDAIAPRLDEEVVAQIGDGAEAPRHIAFHRTIGPREFEALFRAADRIVAHAGIGTLLAAKKHGKPIIVVPRRAALGEHRNDHQLATAAQLEGHAGVYVAQDAAGLEALLRQRSLAAPDGRPSPSIGRLQARLRAAILAPRG